MVGDSAETVLSGIVPSATGTGGRISGTTTSYETVDSSKTASCSVKESSDQLFCVTFQQGYSKDNVFYWTNPGLDILKS